MKKSLLASLAFGLLTAAVVHAQSIPLGGTPEEISAAIDQIGKEQTADQETVSQLIGLLNNSDAQIHIREHAAWALGQLENPAALPALLEGAENKGLLIRAAALDALLRFQSPQALPVYTQLALHDPVLTIRQRATIGLGTLRSDKAIPTLVTLGSDTREEVRGAACLAMATVQSKKNDVREFMKDMAKDSSSYVQQRAEIGLEIAQGKNPVIQEHLQSEDGDIRYFAGLYFQKYGTAKDLSAVKAAVNAESDEWVHDSLKKAQTAIEKRMAAAKKKAARAKRSATSTKKKSAHHKSRAAAHN